jgi:hypothetical protein
VKVGVDKTCKVVVFALRSRPGPIANRQLRREYARLVSIKKRRRSITIIRTLQHCQTPARSRMDDVFLFAALFFPIKNECLYFENSSSPGTRSFSSRNGAINYLCVYSIFSPRPFARSAHVRDCRCSPRSYGAPPGPPLQVLASVPGTRTWSRTTDRY